MKLPFSRGGYEVRILTRSDLDIISDWPKYEYPYAWANFNIVNNLLKDRWMTKNERLDTTWLCIRFNDVLIARGSLISPEENDELIFGIVLKPDQTNRGIGKICVAIIMRMIFTTSNITKVWLETKEDNIRARKTWEKVGFKETGCHYRKDVYGVYSRYIGYRLIKDDFIENP